jgi:hypothetical protein
LGLDIWNIRPNEFSPLRWARVGTLLAPQGTQSVFAAISIPADYTPQWTYVQVLVNSLALGAVKISILLLYLDLFRIEKSTRWIIYALSIAILLYTAIINLVTIFGCRPLNKSWDSLPYGECVNPGVVGATFAAFQIVSDVCILIIPVPIIMSLKLARSKKFAVMAVFLAGFM